MSTLYVLNGGGSGVWLDGVGAGTSADPFRPYHAPVGISGVPTIQGIVTLSSAVIGISGVPTVQGTVAFSNSSIGISGEPTVSLVPRTANGLSSYNFISLATTNAASIKGSAGQVYGYKLYNRGGAEVTVKLYNKATSPTVGTDIPTNLFVLQPSGGANLIGPVGIEFTTGIGMAITKGIIHSDTTAVASGDVVGNFWYK
jgi:hypothetical protein